MIKPVLYFLYLVFSIELFPKNETEFYLMIIVFMMSNAYYFLNCKHVEVIKLDVKHWFSRQYIITKR
ncbi:hypothetical protein A1OW_14940 [Enterovibrio norvegicus]|nr:hypothetical protein A1OW_14940 [Enterovibrio norvegicus]